MEHIKIESKDNKESKEKREKKNVNISDAIWESYESDRNIATRDHIMMEYLYLVKTIASRMFTTYKNFAEYDDIISCGTIALLNAVDKFEYKRNIKFETFASIKIRGAIIDYLRKQDWVPRVLRKNFKDIDAALKDLQNKNGKNPSDEEMAEYLEIDIEEYREILGRSVGATIVSFEETINDTVSLIADNSAGPEQKYIEEELSDTLSSAISELNEKERTIISLYYYDGMKAKQIAQLLEISESRVSQIHSKALLKMKSKVDKYVNM